MKTRKLITCDDAFRAHLIQGALENEGISSVLHNENTSAVLRGFQRDLAGVDIFVYEDDYEAALQVLAQNQMLPERLKFCPYCGSADICFCLKKRKRLRAVLAGVIAALAAAPPGTEHWEYVCNCCGARFDEPSAFPTASEADPDVINIIDNQTLIEQNGKIYLRTGDEGARL